jgi:hypothetical protein
MTKKNLTLLLFTAVLALVYVIWFSDWFRPKTVQIFHTSRNLRASQQGGPLENLIFGLRPEARLKELKVVPLDALATNQDVSPMWHLISDSNSMPVKIFYYGQHINGMHAAIKGVRPEPLETNVTYRLLVITSDRVRSQHDFVVK